MASVPNPPTLEAADLRVVQDLIRFGVLALDQVARRYGVDNDTALQRLAPLIRDGLVEKGEDWIKNSTLFVPTDVARRIAPVGAMKLNVSPPYVRHDLTVVDVADWLLEHEPGSEWRSERQLRMGQRRFGTRHFGNSTPPPHPDGMLLKAGRRIAIEVEITEKEPWRYARIFIRYARAANIDEVRWYVRAPQQRDRLQRLVDNQGFGSSLPTTVELIPTGRVWSWRS